MSEQAILKITPTYQFDGGKCYYLVGFDGVTEIKGLEYSPEPYCTKCSYNVYKGDKLFATVYDSAVAEVIYS